jgi:hypothetical protein
MQSSMVITSLVTDRRVATGSTGLLVFERLRIQIPTGLSRDSAVGIATAYGPNDGEVRDRVPVGSKKCSLLHIVQTGSGAHPAYYPMGTGGSFPGA